MSAEPQLYDPTLFVHPPPSSQLDLGQHQPHADLALEYLAIVKGLKTRTAPSAVKGHLFKLMRAGLAKETDLREKLGRVKVEDGCFDEYVEVATEMKRRMEVRCFLADKQSSTSSSPNATPRSMLWKPKAALLAIQSK
jgi:tRNA-dihydrouridine synthase 1